MHVSVRVLDVEIRSKHPGWKRDEDGKSVPAGEVRRSIVARLMVESPEIPTDASNGSFSLALPYTPEAAASIVRDATLNLMLTAGPVIHLDVEGASPSPIRPQPPASE